MFVTVFLVLKHAQITSRDRFRLLKLELVKVLVQIHSQLFAALLVFFTADLRTIKGSIGVLELGLLGFLCSLIGGLAFAPLNLP